MYADATTLLESVSPELPQMMLKHSKLFLVISVCIFQHLHMHADMAYDHHVFIHGLIINNNSAELSVYYKLLFDQSLCKQSYHC